MWVRHKEEDHKTAFNPTHQSSKLSDKKKNNTLQFDEKLQALSALAGGIFQIEQDNEWLVGQKLFQFLSTSFY